MKLNLTAGDTWPIAGQYTDCDGNGLDITDYDISMVIHYDEPVTLTAVINDAENGTFELPCGENDLVVGTYAAKMKVVNASGQLVSSPDYTVIIAES